MEWIYYCILDGEFHPLCFYTTMDIFNDPWPSDLVFNEQGPLFSLFKYRIAVTKTSILFAQTFGRHNPKMTTQESIFTLGECEIDGEISRFIF